MSAHRRAPRRRPALRRTLTAAVLAVASGSGFLVAAGPATAAGPWFVKPAAQGGNNALNCLSSATACATVTGVLAKAGFVSGDTINVAAGTYADHPAFTTKGAKVLGAGAGTTVFDGSGTTWALAVNGAITVELRDLTLNNGAFTNAAAPGGALPILGGATVNTTNVAVTSSKSSLGGGVGVASGSTLSMTGGSFTNDIATNAGAIFNGGTTTLDGTTLTGNTANGAAIANGGNGGAIYNAGKLTVRNATLSGNKVVVNTNATPGVTGYGGAVFGANLSGNAPTMSFTDTTISGGGVSGGNAALGGAIAVYPTTVGGTTTRIDATRLTLSKNVAQAGGGILTYGSTTLTDSTVDQNQATHASAGSGGGLYAAAATGTNSTLTLDSTDVTGNTAQTGGGGLIAAAGVGSEVRNGSTVTGNSAPTGGGIYNGGVLALKASHVEQNTASNSGAGLYSPGSATLTGSTVDHNTAAFLGGGIATTTGALAVSGGSVNGNSAFGGGGIFVGDNAAASFDGTDLVDNTATGSGGGAILNAGATTINRASLSGNHAIHTSGNTGLGGAIYSGSNNANVNTSLTVRRSTIAGNDAYAASALLTYSPGNGATNKSSIDNTTISGNTSSSAVGAIEQFHPLTITNSTITDNAATDPNSTTVAGGLFMFAPAQVGVAGTIIAGNDGKECTGAVNDGGYNLGDAGTAGCGFSAAKHDVTGDPHLAALANNGGSTKTRLPGPASPALDAVPASTATGLSDVITGDSVSLCGAAATDQRGTTRPQGAKCDIGAVEADQVVPTVDGPATADYTVGSAGASVTFTSTGSPQPALSKSGALPAGVTFQDNGDGTATLSGTPDAGTGGEYPITVTATNEAGSDSTSFTLKVHQAPVLSGPGAATYTVGQPGGPDVFHQTSGYPDATLSTASDLPAGVTFTPQSGGQGTIAGTPDAGTGGVYPITITGSNGTPPDATWPFTLTVNEAPAIAGPGSATFQVGSTGSSGEYTASGFPVSTFAGAGLPAGLAVTGSGSGAAKITGTPADGTGGVYDATLTATNGVNPDATKHVEVIVNEAPELTGPTEARFVVGRTGTIAFSSDGYPVATVSKSGALPDGLTFEAHPDGTATIGGTAAAGTAGVFAITITASNGVDPDAVVHLTLEVVPAVSLTTTALPDAAVGSAYSSIVAASGGMPAYSFSLVSGSLPAGLSLSPAGQITGTPTGPTGTSTFTVKVTDSLDPASTDTRELSIKVVKGTSFLSVDPVVLQTAGLNLRVGIVHATLTGGSPAQPIAGQAVVFKAGASTVCTGITAANGTAACTMGLVPTLQVILNLGVTASYAGGALWEPSSGSAGLIG